MSCKWLEEGAHCTSCIYALQRSHYRTNLLPTCSDIIGEQRLAWPSCSSGLMRTSASDATSDIGRLNDLFALVAFISIEAAESPWRSAACQCLIFSRQRVSLRELRCGVHGVHGVQLQTAEDPVNECAAPCPCLGNKMNVRSLASE